MHACTQFSTKRDSNVLYLQLQTHTGFTHTHTGRGEVGRSVQRFGVEKAGGGGGGGGQ